MIRPVQPINSRPHILFHRGTPWQSAVRCSTNIYAKLFSEAGYPTSYMQSIVHLGHILSRRGHYTSWRRGGRHEDGAWVFTPATLIPYLGRGPWKGAGAAAAAYRGCVPTIPRMVRASGFDDPDIIWTTRPGSSCLKRLFPKARLVFQVVDFYQAFSREDIQALERADYKEADHIFSIGHALTAYLTEELGIPAGKITTLGQGAFIDRPEEVRPVPPDIADLPRPRAIWVGVLDKGDPELFAAAAQAMSQRGGSLILIGPGSAWADALAADCPSVRVMGLRAPENVASYLAHADVALMLYDRNRREVYRGQNPLKLYEYAAAGLPIISTDHEEYRYLAPPVLVARAPGAMPELIERALGAREGMRRESLAFARAHSWRSLFSRAREKLEELKAPR